jgi:hypothetical protein
VYAGRFIGPPHQASVQHAALPKRQLATNDRRDGQALARRLRLGSGRKGALRKGRPVRNVSIAAEHSAGNNWHFAEVYSSANLWPILAIKPTLARHRWPRFPYCLHDLAAGLRAGNAAAWGDERGFPVLHLLCITVFDPHYGIAVSCMKFIL